MAETGEIVAGATGLGAFLGGLLGAWKILKPSGARPEKGDDSMLLQRIARLEQRADESDRREEIDRREMRETVDLLFQKADKTQADVAEIKGMLNARKGQR